jgi:hypothetical protein
MSRDNIHASAFSKLITLSDQAEYLSQKLISTEQGIANARQRSRICAIAEALPLIDARASRSEV